MRTTAAAENTEHLIQGSVKKIKDVSEIVTLTDEAFQQVAMMASKVGGLVGEIAVASNEQSQGIEQINQSVCDMEKVVQGVAATAQQSAVTSEQLHEQAEQMKGIVQKLVSIVSGSQGGGVPKA